MPHRDTAVDHTDARMIDRLLFFSDAVFAIVLTLLVLELRPPPANVTIESGVLEGVYELGRHFAAFAMSFAVGGIFWLAHMRTMRALKQFDWLTAAANLLHLFAITLLPFVAALLGEHINSESAFAVYTIEIMFVAASSALLWLTASRDGGRLIGGISPQRRLASALRSGGIGIAFGIGLPFTLSGMPAIGRFTWVLLFPIIMLANWIGKREGKRRK